MIVPYINVFFGALFFIAAVGAIVATVIVVARAAFWSEN